MVDQVILPLTGSGDSTAAVATERIAGREFQWVKLADGNAGESRGFIGALTTPDSTALGLVTRNIPGGVQPVSQSGAWLAVVTGSVALTASTEAVGVVAQGAAGSSNSPWWVISSGGGAGSTEVDANLTSAGSSKIVGTVNLTSGNQTIGSVAQGSQGSSASPWFVTGTVSLSSGSLNIGTVGQGTAASSTAPWQITGSVALSSSTATIGTVINATSTAQIGSVALTSGTQTIGTVVQGSAGSSTVPWYVVPSSAGTTANTVGSVALLGGTTANSIGSVALLAGTTANTVGSVALVAGSSANNIGQVTQGPGSTANFWFMQSIPFSSAGLARTTVNTSVDASVIAANANRKALVIASLSTAQTVALGLSTGAVTTALGNANVLLPALGQISFGLQGGFPLFTGPIRGINITSTVVGGGVSVMEFT